MANTQHGPEVRHAPSLIRKDDGLFSDAPQEERTTILFDDEPDWNQNVNLVSISEIAIAPRRLPPEQAKRNAQKRREKKSGSGLSAVVCTLIIILCLTVSAMLVVVMMPQTFGYFWTDFGNYCFINGELLRYQSDVVATYKQYRDYLNTDTIYPGIFIDGTHVGGMTVEEARAMLTEKARDVNDAFDITVAIGDRTWPITPQMLSAERDLGNVLERAYAIGRTNTTDIQATLQTPFRERASVVSSLRTEGVNLTTAVSYDRDTVRSLVQKISAYITREPVNAQIQTFDYKTRSFTFSESSAGVTIDEEDLYNAICAAADAQQQGAVVTTNPVIIEPAVSHQALADGFTLISAFTTSTTNDSNRNTNIRLACEAINGTSLMPGETFSFNEATGERTTAKGYKSAGAISGGESIKEIGGGVCQVSSTIFNAAARADLEILKRSPHAWPSTYVNIGEDATVNWPDLDFKFRNNSENPVFIITYYKDRKVSCEIWGMTLGEGITIDLDSTIVQTISAPADVKYVYNGSLDYGMSKTTVKARNGYVVDTYKIWYKDGTEIKREKLHSSTYKSYQQVVEYNSDMVF